MLYCLMRHSITCFPSPSITLGQYIILHSTTMRHILLHSVRSSSPRLYYIIFCRHKKSCHVCHDNLTWVQLLVAKLCPLRGEGGRNSKVAKSYMCIWQCGSIRTSRDLWTPGTQRQARRCATQEMWRKNWLQMAPPSKVAGQPSEADSKRKKGWQWHKDG